MKKFLLSLALAGGFLVPQSRSITLDDIQIWTGSGTNRAALVIEWSVPESLTNSSVPVTIADKTLVWGYKFNGSSTGLQMLNAIMLADPKLYAVEAYGGSFIEGIGYNLNGDGNIGITDGTNTNYFANGILGSPSVDIDSAHAINTNDLYWGGLFGPNWESWTETNDAGGLFASPNRGTNQYWTADDTNAPYSGSHGQWSLAGLGLDQLPLTNGSWIGYSVAAGEYESDLSAAYNIHKHAPVSPEGTYIAYVCNTNDFATQIVSTSNIFTTVPYNTPVAVLGRPTLKFIDHFGLGAQKNKIDRSKLIEAPYWTDPASNNVIAEINVGGQITVNMGRRIYDDPNNPYGVDFIVYGNSFFSANGYTGGAVTDGTDMNAAGIPGGSTSGTFGHPTIVSVSQDGVTWTNFPVVSTLFPVDSYRWDGTNHCWTEEQMLENKPRNPAMTLNGGIKVNQALDEFVGAFGGTGYDLKSVGLPWIQFVRVYAGTNLNDTNAGDYTVIDSIAAVNPVVVGDGLSITPANLTNGMTNLVFQKPSDTTKTLIALNVHSADSMARFNTVTLSEFSSFAPVVGNVSSAYQITVKPITNAVVNVSADVSLRAADSYAGTGGDLRLYQWNGAAWASQPFTYSAINNQVTVGGLTNFSAFVVTQIVPPRLSIKTATNGFALQFLPVANATNTLERSSDFVTWSMVTNIVATNASAVTVMDSSATGTQEYYRVQVSIP